MDDRDEFVDSCKELHNAWQQHQKDASARMQKIYSDYNKKLQKMREQTDSMYKNLLQWLIESVNHDESHSFVNALKEMMDLVKERPATMDEYADVLRDTTLLLRQGEKPRVEKDTRQWPFGKKPLYFDFMD